MQHEIVLKLFHHYGQGEGVWEQNKCYHVAIFLDSFQFDMLHDHALKKFNFDLLLYFVILFNWICIMTLF